MYADPFPNELEVWRKRGAVVLDVRELEAQALGLSHAPTLMFREQGSSRFRISGVPDTIISGARQRRVLGGQPDRVFVEAVLRAGGAAGGAV